MSLRAAICKILRLFESTQSSDVEYGLFRSLYEALPELGALERGAESWRGTPDAVLAERVACAAACDWVAEQLTDRELAVAAKRCAKEILKRGDK